MLMVNQAVEYAQTTSMHEIHSDQYCTQTAGLTLAARLSEDHDTSVLVLEAGEANIDDPNLRESCNWIHPDTYLQRLQ